MKPIHARRTTGGFSGWDALIVVVAVGLVIAVGLPLLARPRGRTGHRVTCVSNLKQVGLAFRMWSNDHSEKFPWQFAMAETNGGTMEYTNSSKNTWRHFAVVSNELNNPRVLRCFEDTERKHTTDWRAFTNNAHLSYFAGLDSSEVLPQSILAGDRNLQSSSPAVNGILAVTADDRLSWEASLHKTHGNFALGDGSVQIVSTQLLKKQFQSAFESTRLPVFRLALPE